MLDLHEGILLEFAERSATSFDEDIKEGLLRGIKPHDRVKENQTKNALRSRRKLAGQCIGCGETAAVKADGTRAIRCTGCAAARTPQKAA